MPVDQEIRKILKLFVKDFVIAFGIRGTISLVPSLIKYGLKGYFRFMFRLPTIVLKSYGKKSFDFGLFVSFFFTTFKVSKKLMNILRKKSDHWDYLFAGAVSSTSLVFQSKSDRLDIAQYLFLRALRMVYLHYKNVYNYPTWFTHGDSLLFALCCGQIVYGVIMRPETLPRSYVTFLTRLTRMPVEVLTRIRHNLRGFPIDARIKGFERVIGLDSGRELNYVSCDVTHPSEVCRERLSTVFSRTFFTGLRIYFALHAVPALLFKHQTIIKK